MYGEISVMRKVSRKDYFPDACWKVALYNRLLRKIADFVFLKSVGIFNRTAHRRLKIQQRPHKRGLTRAVFTDNTALNCIWFENYQSALN